MLLFIQQNLQAGGTSYTLTGLAGTYSLSGGSASLKVGRAITANAGTYSVNGGTATLKVGRSLTASAGTYSLTGGSAALSVGRKLTASAGSYSITGSSATLTKATGATAYSLTGLAGSYVIAGSPAVMAYTPAAPILLQPGDGVDPRKRKPREFDQEREESLALRQMLERALNPVKDEDAVEVVESGDGVVVITKSGTTVAMPKPEAIDLRAMSLEIGQILAKYQVQAEQTRRAEAQAIARQAIEAARENVRRVMRKRRQEEFLLLMT